MLDFLKKMLEWLGLIKAENVKDEENKNPLQEDFKNSESASRFASQFFFMTINPGAIVNIDKNPEISDAIKEYIDVNLFQFPIDSEKYSLVHRIINNTIMRSSIHLEEVDTRDYQKIEKMIALYDSPETPFEKYINEKRNEIKQKLSGSLN